MDAQPCMGLKKPENPKPKKVTKRTLEVPDQQEEDQQEGAKKHKNEDVDDNDGGDNDDGQDVDEGDKKLPAI